MQTTTQPKHTNRLVDTTSPYLLQHAHNPVDWYEWGPDALDRARGEDKPIFLSIGYSACHWCHVMERESFENDDVAALLNEHFVCIKVDREERPDLDDLYMTATQILTRQGGWPMSVWLTPDLRPFFAGTYFPPDDRYGRPGFKNLLRNIAAIWESDRDKALEQASKLTEAISQVTSADAPTDLPPKEIVFQTGASLAHAFDPVEGGISGGGTNKFPPSMAMDVMLRAYHASTPLPEHEALASETRKGHPKKELLELIELTLDKMANGGIYDHLGGGIARYSTDVHWLVPHFEKMLYDQALVSDVYLKGYQAAGKPLYARRAREIFDYVIADLQSPEGGFYSTRDADSEGVEGKFYVWTRKEVDQALGDDASLFCDYYDISEAGNWEGHNIPNIPRPLETVAKLHKLDPEGANQRVESARRKLFDLREKRIKPHLDDKILASWNGLMIASLARGACILNEPKYADSAARAAKFVLSQMVRDGRLQRTYRKGKTHTLAYLDDHAFMIEALINLYEATFDPKWLDHAVKLNDDVLKHFRDDKTGGFFFTADDAEKLLVRTKDANDSAIPSGNSVQLMNLLRLSVLLDRKDLAAEAEKLLKAFGTQLKDMPFRSERMLSALDFYHRRPREVALITLDAAARGFAELLDATWRTYVPNLIVAAQLPGADAAALARKIPLLAEKKAVGGKPTAYVCKNFACQAPATDPQALRQQLSR